jgi:hypothetical protein
MRDTMRGSFYLWNKIADNIYYVQDEFGSRYENKYHDIIDKDGNFIMDRDTFVKQLIEKQKIEKENFKPIVNLIGLAEFIENPNTEWILSEYSDLQQLSLLNLKGSLKIFKRKILNDNYLKNKILYLYATTETATVQICCFNNFNQYPEVIKFFMTHNWTHSTLNKY